MPQQADHRRKRPEAGLRHPGAGHDRHQGLYQRDQAGAPAGREGEHRQERVFGQHVPRDTHPHERHHRPERHHHGGVPRPPDLRPRQGRAVGGQESAGHHQRHPGPVQGGGGQDGAGVWGLPPEDPGGRGGGHDGHGGLQAGADSEIRVRQRPPLPLQRRRGAASNRCLSTS